MGAGRLLCEVVHFDALAIATALKLATNASATPGATSSSKPSSPPSLGGGNNLPMVVLVRLWRRSRTRERRTRRRRGDSRTAARPIRRPRQRGFSSLRRLLGIASSLARASQWAAEAPSSFPSLSVVASSSLLPHLQWRWCASRLLGWSLHCHRVGNTESEVIMSLIENGMALLLLRSGGAGEGSVIPTRSSSDGESSRTESELRQFMQSVLRSVLLPGMLVFGQEGARIDGQRDEEGRKSSSSSSSSSSSYSLVSARSASAAADVAALAATSAVVIPSSELAALRDAALKALLRLGTSTTSASTSSGGGGSSKSSKSHQQQQAAAAKKASSAAPFLALIGAVTPALLAAPAAGARWQRWRRSRWSRAARSVLVQPCPLSGDAASHLRLP